MQRLPKIEKENVSGDIARFYGAVTGHHYFLVIGCDKKRYLHGKDYFPTRFPTSLLCAPPSGPIIYDIWPNVGAGAFCRFPDLQGQPPRDLHCGRRHPLVSTGQIPAEGYRHAGDGPAPQMRPGRLAGSPGKGPAATDHVNRRLHDHDARQRPLRPHAGALPYRRHAHV